MAYSGGEPAIVKLMDEKIANELALVEEIAKECTGKSVILTGDFNTEFDKDLKKTLIQAGFIHAKSIAKKRRGSDENHKKSSKKQLIECDHIFIKPAEKFTVLSYDTGDAISKKTSEVALTRF